MDTDEHGFEKRRRTAAVQDASAKADDSRMARSVLECASPLALWNGQPDVARSTKESTQRRKDAKTLRAGCGKFFAPLRLCVKTGARAMGGGSKDHAGSRAMFEMRPSIHQLQGGVRDFCSVLDQAPTAFFWESFFLPRFQNDSVDAVKLDNLRNATIESSLLSIRILNDFFRGADFPTDIKAQHYAGFSSPGEFLTATERTDINKHSAHLTTERADAFPKYWKLDDLAVRAHNAAESFIRFLLSPAGMAYRPADFDLQSRLAMCQGFECHVRAYRDSQVKSVQT